MSNNAKRRLEKLESKMGTGEQVIVAKELPDTTKVEILSPGHMAGVVEQAELDAAREHMRKKNVCVLIDEADSQL